MYTKLLLVLCPALVAAGGLLQSSQIAYNSALPVNYQAPVLTKAAHFAPVPSYSHAGPIPYNAIAYQPAPVYKNVAAAPLIAKPIPVPVQYSSAPLPVPVSYSAPNYASYVQAKSLAVPAVYPGAQVLKSAVTYSAAPAVSHVSFNGLGVSYSW